MRFVTTDSLPGFLLLTNMFVQPCWYPIITNYRVSGCTLYYCHGNGSHHGVQVSLPLKVNYMHTCGISLIAWPVINRQQQQNSNSNNSSNISS
jgi:hypothetical protein